METDLSVQSIRPLGHQEGVEEMAQATGGSDLGWERCRDRRELIWGRGSSARRPSVKAAFRGQWQQSRQWHPNRSVASAGSPALGHFPRVGLQPPC